MKKNFIRSDKGAAAIEMAFIFPFMCLLYMSLQDFTALVTFNRKITATAAAVSDTVSQYSTTITKPTVTDVFLAAPLIMQPTPVTDVHVGVYDYYLKNGAPVLRWQMGNGNGPTCKAPDTSNFATLMASGNDLVVSVACMNYTPFIATFMGTSILGSTNFLLSQSITSRPRTSMTLNCVVATGNNTVCS